MEIRSFPDEMVYDPNTLTKKILFNTKEALCFVLNLMPGQTIPAHRHENSVLTAAVIKGECEIAVNQDQ
jgi:quercetin dioxygenase-like cupin family protein